MGAPRAPGGYPLCFSWTVLKSLASQRYMRYGSGFLCGVGVSAYCSIFPDHRILVCLAKRVVCAWVASDADPRVSPFHVSRLGSSERLAWHASFHCTKVLHICSYPASALGSCWVTSRMFFRRTPLRRRICGIIGEKTGLSSPSGEWGVVPFCLCLPPLVLIHSSLHLLVD